MEDSASCPFLNLEAPQPQDERFMRAALTEAQAAFRADEVPVGAVVECKGRIIGRGHNLTEALTDVTAHAEMQAITAAAQWMGGKYLPDCTLYVTVEPCVMCAGAIGWAQIGRVVVGTPDPKRGFSAAMARSPLHPKCRITMGVLQPECAALMKTFFAKKR